MKHRAIYIGFDPREADAFAVARASIRRHLTQPIPIYGLVLSTLRRQGLYTRPTEYKVNGDGRPHLIDVLSKREDYDGAMSTEFAISRFLVPHLAGRGLALFMDSDMLARGNLVHLFDACEERGGAALYCVQHNHAPTETVKMDGQTQTRYARKNWSSMMIFDCDHRATERLTLQMVNTLPGRELHRFCWLNDDEIGGVGAEWNYLVGHNFRPGALPAEMAVRESPNGAVYIDPLLIHMTDGVPSMAGYENVEFADEWRAELAQWAR